MSEPTLGNVGVIDAASFRRTKGTLLLLDIDYRTFPWTEFASTFRVFRDTLTFLNCAYVRSERGWHIIIEIREKLTIPETIALQAALGDDPKRVALNLSRWFGMKGKKVNKFWLLRWNLIFSQKIQ